MCCEISEGIPNKKRHNAVKSTKPLKVDDIQKDNEVETMEKIEIYYFDHGNSA